MEMVLVCFVRLRSEHRLKCATRHHHEPASRTRISDSYAERPLPPIRLWRHADGIWHWKGRNDLGPVNEMCSPEASTNPETSNALAAYEPLPATREGLCGISAPILLKSLGGETTSHSGLPNGCGLVVKYWFAGGLQNQFARCCLENGSREDMSVPLRECLLMTQSRHE